MLDVYVYGSGECDQLGLGDSDILEAKNPKKVGILNVEPSSKVYQICCGGMHTLVLTTMGKVFSWGCNDDGALGRGGADNQPVAIDSIPYPMNNITAGDSFSIAYNTELNTIYQWGAFRNNSGKIADPVTSPVEIDRKLLNNKLIKKIVCGSNHALAIAGKSLYGWGDCELGQIGKLPKPDQPVEWSLKPQLFQTKDVLDIFTGSNHSFSISKKGKREVFKAWGHNNWGQLGLGHKKNTCIPTEVELFSGIKIKYATGGDHHSIVLAENGDVYAWGRNDEGQCGMKNEKKEILEKLAEPVDEENSAKEATEEAEEDSAESAFSILRPKKIEKLSLKEDEAINRIFSSMNFNYALCEKKNQAYSWGMGEMYVLANKKDDNEYEPFNIPREFFFNKKIANISLGSNHVVVALADPSLAQFPELEYNLEQAREELRTKIMEKRQAPKKRKLDIGLDNEEEIARKRPRKNVNYKVDKNVRPRKHHDNLESKKSQHLEKAGKDEDNKEAVLKENQSNAIRKKSFDSNNPKHDKQMKLADEEENNSEQDQKSSADKHKQDKRKPKLPKAKGKKGFKC